MPYARLASEKRKRLDNQTDPDIGSVRHRFQSDHRFAVWQTDGGGTPRGTYEREEGNRSGDDGAVWPSLRRSRVGASHVGAGLRQCQGRSGRRSIPGATLVLISESRNTKSTPVVSSTTGDFVFPNITPDRYTLEVTMTGFKTLAAGRHRGEPWRPHRRARHHARGRRTDRNRERHGRVADDSGAERRALVHGHERSGAEPAAPEPQLLPHGAVRPRHGRPQREQHQHRPARRRRQHELPDGRHRHHRHRQQHHPARR